jgi:phosphate:Na+ symporter
MNSWHFKTISITLIMIVFPSGILFAADRVPQEISWDFLIIGLLGGLALFLYGMEKMSEGMKKSAGNKMRSVLAALTKNRIIGLMVGAFVTMVIQSSSATTVMLVSFVQAGLMNFSQSLGVILGADIGTTVTAQLIAFKLTD